MPFLPVMSINSDVSQVPVSSSSREDQAKIAGHMIYNSVRGGPDTNQLPQTFPPETNNPMMNGSMAVDPMMEGKISSVRRTFCLFVLFDLILMFILWVIYTQLIGDTGFRAFESQVADYSFKTSLFDSVMLSAVRFTFLLLVYGLYRSNHWWMVALTTALTCGILIAKIFIFDFEGSKSSNNPMSYCIIIISFVLAWLETWFLDFKVLPQERKLRIRMNSVTGRSYGSTFIGQSYQRFQNDDLNSVITEDNQFYSPLDSEASDDEDDRHSVARGSTTRQDNDYIRLARHSWEVLWTYATSPESDWKLESGKDEFLGVVHSKKVKGVGKVFRMTGAVNRPPVTLFEALNYNPEAQPEWNTAIKESKVIQVVDNKTDVLYNVASEVAGGVITSRDFVSLRVNGKRDGAFVMASMGVNHPERPATKKYIRGKNGVGGFVFRPYKGDQDKCVLTWYLNTDIGGWFPQSLIDANMAKVLLEFLRDLRKHLGDKESES